MGDVIELSGLNFADVVNDPKKSVLVLFVNSDCQSLPGCKHASGVFVKVAAEFRKRKQQESRYKSLTFARIDQSLNEHPEYVSGTPWLRFWPRGKRKKTVNIIQRKLLNVDISH